MTRQKSSNWKLYLALASSLATLAIHFYLTRHYFTLHLGLSDGSALCNINKSLNCDAVSASKFSALFGVPMALFGLTTQMVVFLFTFIFGFRLSSDHQWQGRQTFYLSFVVALASVVMGSISVFKLGAYCLFCIVAYILSFAHLWAIRSLQVNGPAISIGSDLWAAVTSKKWVGITFASILPLSFLFNSMFLDHFGGSQLKDAVESSFLTWQSEPPVPFTIDGLVKGPADATMTIVEFADFLCPHCKHAAPTLKVFAETHPNVRVIFKAFPLDGICNSSENMPKGDGVRCLMAKNVFCAEKVGQKGWLVYEDTFNRQEDFFNLGPSASAELLKGLAEKQGLDPVAMENCRNSDETHQSIINQAKEGIAGKIEGTPSIFVNGKFLPRGQILPVLQRVYDSLE